MLIVIKNKYENIRTIKIAGLESFKKIFEENINPENKPLEANIFAINEIINFYQLRQIKLNLKKQNFKTLNIFSNKRETVLSGKSLKVNSTFVSENDLKNALSLAPSKDLLDVFHKGTVRSGARISSNGDLFIVGDVNPGAIVSAKRNIYVWGKLLGNAFAGEGGEKEASIASLYLNPLQLRIHDVVAIGPKDKPKDFHPEIAVLEKQSIIIKPLIIDRLNKSM